MNRQPILTLPPGSSRRFRVYNATNGRFLRLAVDGHHMTLVGTDGGLLSTPVAGLEKLLLAPAKRVDLKSRVGDVELREISNTTDIDNCAVYPNGEIS